MAEHAKQLKKVGEPLCIATAPAYRTTAPTIAGRAALLTDGDDGRAPPPSAPAVVPEAPHLEPVTPRPRPADAWVAVLH
eukprot:181844-Lingulodinium_polyedra.AAC.1